MQRNESISFRKLPSRPMVWMLAILTTVASVASAAALREDDAAPSPLTGIFTVSIAKADVPPDLAGGAALVGQWTLDLHPDNTYSLARGDVGEVVTGNFEAGQATLAFASWAGAVGCAIPEVEAEAESAAATYAWRSVDGQLILTPIDDACAERLILLTTTPLASFESCVPPVRTAFDPFAVAISGTPASGVTVGEGVAAQEGYEEGADAESAIDELLRLAGGCWASADIDGFLALHGDGLLRQIEMMGPAEDFTRELSTFMETPLALQRIGAVNLEDPDHAWAYVEVNLGDSATPQRVDFVQEQGAWLFGSFVLFGPPDPSSIPGPMS